MRRKFPSLIDAYSIFRGRSVIRWWQIRNYQPISTTKPGLHEYVNGFSPDFIDATTDPFPENEIVSVTTAHELHKIAPVLVSDLELAQRHRNLNFIYYPLWVLSAIEKQIANPVSINCERTKKLSCLNRIPKLHRFWTYYLLSQQAWFDQVHVSFAGLSQELGACGDVETLDDLYVLGKETRDFFEQHSKDFPRTGEPDYSWANCHDASTPAYTDCWANLATESSVHAFCITEKTTKALRAGCLFFPVASAGFIGRLGHMGFDFDYQGINYGFGSEQEWRQRTKQCVVEIANRYDTLSDIWHDNLDRIKYNSELFLSDRLLDYCLQDSKEYV